MYFCTVDRNSRVMIFTLSSAYSGKAKHTLEVKMNAIWSGLDRTMCTFSANFAALDTVTYERTNRWAAGFKAFTPAALWVDLDWDKCACQYNTIPYNTIQYSTVQYSTVQYKTRQDKTRQDSTVPYRSVPFRSVPFRTVPYRSIA